MTPFPLQVIAIHGVPRSGTSWLGQLFNSSEHAVYRYQPLFSHAFKGRLSPDTGRAEADEFFAELFATDDEFVLQRGTASLAGYTLDFPKTELTHLVYKEVRHHDVLARLLEVSPKAHVVGIIRHPCAVIESWRRAPREFDPDWDLNEEWRRAPRKNRGDPGNWYGFERWKEFASMLHQLQTSLPDRVTLLRYESLVARPADELTRLFARCGLAMTEQVQAFCARSQQRDDGQPYGVFRSARPPDIWRQALDPRITAAIHENLRGSELETYLACSPFDSESRR